MIVDEAVSTLHGEVWVWRDRDRVVGRTSRLDLPLTTKRPGCGSAKARVIRGWIDPFMSARCQTFFCHSHADATSASSVPSDDDETYC